MSAARSRAGGRHRSRGRPDGFTSNEKTAYVHSWTRAFANAVTRHEALIRRGGERGPGWTNPARYLLPATDVDALNHRDRAHPPTAAPLPIPGQHPALTACRRRRRHFPSRAWRGAGSRQHRKARTNPSEPFRRYAVSFRRSTLRLGLSLDNSLNRGLGDERGGRRFGQWPCVKAVSLGALRSVFAGRSDAGGLNARPLGALAAAAAADAFPRFSYASRTTDEMRPRADTTRPLALAHSRIAAVSARHRPARIDIRCRVATLVPVPVAASASFALRRTAVLTSSSCPVRLHPAQLRATRPVMPGPRARDG